MHINDLRVATSQVRLVADDCLMYRPVHSIADQFELQKDLSALEQWGDVWGIGFNASNRLIMHVGLAPLYNIIICCVTRSFLTLMMLNILDVTMSSELSWSSYLSSIYGGAHVSLGFPRRNLKHLVLSYKIINRVQYRTTHLWGEGTCWGDDTSWHVKSQRCQPLPLVQGENSIQKLF